MKYSVVVEISKCTMVIDIDGSDAGFVISYNGHGKFWSGTNVWDDSQFESHIGWFKSAAKSMDNAVLDMDDAAACKRAGYELSGRFGDVACRRDIPTGYTDEK